MMVRQNAAARRCEIWIGCRERDTYAGNEEYRETVAGTARWDGAYASFWRAASRACKALR